MKEWDDGKRLSDIIQLDDVYWGGECRGDKRSRGSPNKPPFVAEISHGGPSVTLALIVMWFQMDWLVFQPSSKLIASIRVS